MTTNVNETLNKIQKLGYKILPSGKLKKSGAKAIDTAKFYSDNHDSFPEISPRQFEDIVKAKASSTASDTRPHTIPALLDACQFIAQKFRWFVTKERTKLYYEKTREDAEEYLLLTTDKDSPKFFNSLTNDELTALFQLVSEYNMTEVAKDNLLTMEKVVKLLLEDLRQNPNFRLDSELVTLSNSPSVPCNRYFDMASIRDRGDAYVKQHGVRPPTPAWDAFFARIRNQKMVPVVKAFLCGIFVAKNRAKQCLYIWGAGNDGKSQITEALTQLMGEEITFIMDQHMRSNQFSSYDAYGKRLCIGEELSAPNVIKNKTFHAITGQSRVRIEPKGEQAFSARLYASAVITSNEKPNLEKVINQTTRLLYIEVDSVDVTEMHTNGNNWKEHLNAEIESMVYDGIKYYKQYNPNGSAYIMPEDYEEVLDQLYDEETIRVQEFIDRVFVSDIENCIKNKIHDGFLSYLEKEYYQNQSIPPEYRNNSIVKRIQENLRSKFPHMTFKRKSSEGSMVRVISGIGISKSYSGLDDIFEV